MPRHDATSTEGYRSIQWGGGLSEGFRQAGGSTILAIDKDRVACETFRINHPTAEVRQLAVEDIDASSLPACDVLVGGPPCIEFSSSNRGGGGNILEGLRLVQAFLRIVWQIAPRWWVMENVERVTQFLPNSVPLRWIGVDEDGVLDVPTRLMFNTADYGVPQARKRFLMGRFPLPMATHAQLRAGSLFDLGGSDREPWRCLGEVLRALPNPLEPVPAGVVSDPNYDIAVRGSDLTDHFMDTRLEDVEAERIRRQRQEHAFYGRMAFPDELDRPARTVVATQLGRETLVIATPSEPGFRRATIRECACLQSFPISYQFGGGSASARYRVVGDAVPPRLGWHIARMIVAEASGDRVAIAPSVSGSIRVRSDAVVFNRRVSVERRFHENRRFQALLPGKELRGLRAQLENRCGDVGGAARTSWVAMLYLGEGKCMRSQNVSAASALRIMQLWAVDPDSRSRVDRLKKSIDDVLKTLPGPERFQSIWSGRSLGVGPDDVVQTLNLTINKVFPKERFGSVRLLPDSDVVIAPTKGLLLRVVAGLTSAAFVAEALDPRPVRWESERDGVGKIEENLARSPRVSHDQRLLF